MYNHRIAETLVGKTWIKLLKSQKFPLAKFSSMATIHLSPYVA